MSWRQAKSIVQLRKELDKKYPKRTTPDWIIGDAAHRSRASDHNPNKDNVVCAVDIRDGNINLAEVAEHIKGLLSDSAHPVKYVIFNRRIAGRHTNGEWRAYTGSNPHTTHVHVSVGRGADGQSTGPYDSTASWKFDAPKAKPKPKWGPWYNGKPNTRTVKRWDRGADVHFIQRYIGSSKCGPADGDFGKFTESGVKWYQKMRGIKVDGIVGPITWRNLGR